MNDRSRMSPRLRLFLGVLGLSAAALLATARSLTPDPRGFGTHEQLGLAPCRFSQWTGVRCPTCGTTTAWAYAMRGRVAAAAAANAGGLVSCGAAMIAAPWALASAAAGRWLGGRPNSRVLLIIGGAWLATTVFDWVRRLTIG